ncbi:MAG: hypothetical protein RLZZ188_637 [Verrucomicrobiota bacterium]
MHESFRILLLQRLNVVLAALATLAAGLTVGWLVADFIDGRIRQDMLRRAPVAALVLALDIDPFAQPASLEALSTPVHGRFVERARRLCLLNPSVRAISLVRMPVGEGPAVYLFDFREAGDGNAARPGDPYEPRFGSNALSELRRDGRALLVGPFAAQDGPRGVAYALLPSFTEGGRRDVRHAIRVEADANEWRHSVLWGGLLAGLGACGIVGIPLAMLLLAQRQRIQSGVIRNLSEAMEQANSAILILDPSGRIEYCNEVGSRHLRVPRHSLIGRNWREFLVAGEPGAPETEIVGNLAAGVAWQGEWTCRCADGPSFPVRGGFSPVRRRKQRLVAFVVVFDDVTEVRRREQSLREVTEQARAGDRAKGNFLATMSHEVRTPLNGIVGFTGLLLETPVSEEQRDYLLAIRASADALTRLTGDILDFARIDSGNARIELAPCDPRECLEEAIELHAAAAAEKGVEIFQRVSPAVPALVVTDQGRLRQILVNLVGNAAKFTERGEIEVSVSVPAEDGNEAGIRLEFVVRDTGPGIAEGDQARLFRPFSQIEGVSVRRHGGAGLGLAISRSLVEMLGGKIDLASRPGEGATFTFSIRARVEQPPRIPRVSDVRVALLAPPGPRRDALAATLRSWGAEIIEASGMAGLPARDCTVIVRDLGQEEARLLASAGMADDVDTRTIALVPLSLGADQQTALRARFQSLLLKPLRPAALFPLVAGKAPARAPAAQRRQFGLRVLVAEDNAVNQRLIRLMLEGFGCSVTVAGDGREALAALSSGAEPQDLVLLDMHMPELDGLSVLRAIRAGEAGPAVRTVWAVAISADVRAEQRAASQAAGLDEYLVKPVSLRGLEEMLLRFEATRSLRRSGG